METTKNERKVPRMRYTESALAQLREEDPGTPVTAYMVKRLISTGAIPSIKVGRRRLFNYDDLLEYLASGSPTEIPGAGEEPDVVGGIRRIRA